MNSTNLAFVRRQDTFPKGLKGILDLGLNVAGFAGLGLFQESLTEVAPMACDGGQDDGFGRLQGPHLLGAENSGLFCPHQGDDDPDGVGKVYEEADFLGKPRLHIV